MELKQEQGLVVRDRGRDAYGKKDGALTAQLRLK